MSTSEAGIFDGPNTMYPASGKKDFRENAIAPISNRTAESLGIASLERVEAKGA